MDSSYTNSVGATNPGGINPGNLNAQNTNSNAQVLQGGQQNPAQPVMSQQPMQPTPKMQQPVISSGTGDVVIGGGNIAASKKSRKGVVILIILVVLLALVGGGFLLWQNGVFGGNGGGNVQTSQMTDLQKSYNSYVNYVLWGVESDGKPDYDAMEQARPYFEDLSDDQINAYVTKADAKYSTFETAYNAAEIKNKSNISILKSYFQEIPLVAPINVSEMITIYSEYDEAEVLDKIKETYTKPMESEENLDEFLGKQKQLGDITLTIIKKASNNNCIQAGKVLLDCSGLADDDRKAWSDAIIAVNDSSTEIEAKAYLVIARVYDSLYTTGGNNE